MDITRPAELDMRRLWLGGVATAVVAALIVVVGVVIARGILGISVLAPATAGDLGTSATAVYAVFAAACALLGTGVARSALRPVLPPTDQVRPPDGEPCRS